MRKHYWLVQLGIAIGMFVVAVVNAVRIHEHNDGTRILEAVAFGLSGIGFLSFALSSRRASVAGR